MEKYSADTFSNKTELFLGNSISRITAKNVNKDITVNSLHLSHTFGRSLSIHAKSSPKLFSAHSLQTEKLEEYLSQSPI
jgi:hypothetical protein